MPVRPGSRSTAVIVASTAVGVAVIGGAYAATEGRGVDNDRVVHACIRLSDKTLRLETPQRPCVTSGPQADRERAITWNKKGKTGSAGAVGAAGPQGREGSVGSAGPSGATGSTGPSGAAGSTGPSGAAGSPGPSGAPGSAGPSGPVGPSGAPGSPGASGAPGSAGPSGPAGPSGAPGSPGASGSPGAAGSGPVLIDGNGATLGAVVNAGNYTFTVRTPAGYLATIKWDGTFPGTTNLEFSGPNCDGTAYIYTLQQNASISSRAVAYSIEYGTGTLFVPAANAAQLAAGFVTPASYSYASAELDNDCQSDGPSSNGYELKPVSSTDIGLPALVNGAVKTPITFKQ